MMSFSVVMPVYNKAGFVSDSIKSVLGQRFGLFELIIINDGSTDRSLEIIESFNDDRIRIFTITNGGISFARNYGIRMANYDFIAFIDADDTWSTDYLLEIDILIHRYPKCNAFITGYEKKYPEISIPVILDVREESGVLFNYFERRMRGWGVHTSSVVVRKNELLKIGAFPMLVANFEDRTCIMLGINGEALRKIPLEIVEDNGNWRQIETNDLHLLHIPLDHQLRLSVRGVLAEDQYVWDLLACYNRYGYSTRVLSTWNGNVPGQATRSHQDLPVASQMIALKEIAGHSKPILKYLKYLDSDLIIRFRDLSSRQFVDMLYVNGFFSRRNLSYSTKNLIVLRRIILLLNLGYTIQRKVFGYLRVFVRTV